MGEKSVFFYMLLILKIINKNYTMWHIHCFKLSGMCKETVQKKYLEVSRQNNY